MIFCGIHSLIINNHIILKCLYVTKEKEPEKVLEPARSVPTRVSF